MVRQLLGNIKGPKGDTGARGPQGETGSDVELQPFDGRNFIEVEHEVEGLTGNVERVNGTDVFTSTGTNTTTAIQYPNEYELKEGKPYVISFDYYSESVTNSDNIWIINTNGLHNNYSIHPDRRYDYTNIYNIPLGVETRCYVVFTPEYDLIGSLRVGSNRNDGDTGAIKIKNVSLSEGYDISYKPKTHPIEWDGNQYANGYLSTGFTNVTITSQSLSNNGTKLPINSSTAITENCSVSGGSILLNRGVWKITVDVSLENTSDSPMFYIRAIQNSNTIATSRGHLNGATYSLNLVVRTTGDPIDLYVVQNSGSNVSTLSASFNRVMAEYLGAY